MAKIGYLRVSTLEQRPDRQIDGLGYQCDELYVEKISAVSESRPIFDAIIKKLKPGDTLVVWDLDRAFRSVIDAITQANRLREKGVEFKIANLAVDTGTPSGMLIYTVMSAFAEFERKILIQRTREGLAAARQRGTRLGRPRKLSDVQIAQARSLLASDCKSLTDLAESYGVSALTLRRSLRR